MAECSICLGVLDQPCATPCGHTFCRRCVVDMLASGQGTWYGACPLCREPLNIYDVRDVGSGRALASPPVSTIFGSIFVQASGLGVASYHFDTKEDCYISYAEAPRSWRLDDGTSPPAKKPFEDPSWDPSTRTFRGNISWDPPFNGARRWEYEIVFACDFSAIVGGRVVQDGGGRDSRFDPPWRRGPGLSYLRWMPPPPTIFGTVFVQGLAYAAGAEGVASYHFDSEKDCYISYASAPEPWLLDDGSRPPQRKPFEDASYVEATRTFRGTVTWPLGFGGAVRWEYEMVFAESFGRIAGGAMRALDRDGAVLSTSPFVDPTAPDAAEVVGRRRPLLYVRRPTPPPEPIWLGED